MSAISLVLGICRNWFLFCQDRSVTGIDNYCLQMLFAVSHEIIFIGEGMVKAIIILWF